MILIRDILQSRARLSASFRAPKGGFTLVELLVVMAIIGLLVGLGGPTLLSVFRGSALTQGGQMIEDQLNLYRQLALANNYPVEVRLYKFVDPSITGDPGYYRAIQAFSLTAPTLGPSGTFTYTKTAITKALRVPSSVIIDSGSTLSQLIFYGCPAGSTSPGQQASQPGDPPLLNVGSSYSYAYFQFNPDGSTNLPAMNVLGPWIFFLTVHPISSKDSSKLAQNKNYFTVQVDPVNGRVYSYRP